MKLLSTLAASLAAAPAAIAQPTPDAAPVGPAVGTEFFYSADSDDTEVSRFALDLDLRNAGPDRYLGVRLERANYDPGGTGRETRDRAFLRVAEPLGNWQLHARIGTDGDTLLGALNLNDNSRFRKEFFIDRDIVETRQGVDRGLYSTFIGATIDLPANDRNIFTLLAGAQAFTGRNVRWHLRGNYVHVIRPDWGLSGQLRLRYAHSSEPGEFDYYSPRWYAEVLPVLQLRRFVGGWELVGAAGYGAQRDSGSDWRSSRYAHLRFRSPLRSNWAVNGAITYTNTPAAGGTLTGYSYVQFSLGLSRRF